MAGCNEPTVARYVLLYRDQVKIGSEDDTSGDGVVLNFCEFQVFGLYTLGNGHNLSMQGTGVKCISIHTFFLLSSNEASVF